MKLTISLPAKALSKVYLRQSLKREQIELFKANLGRMFERIRSDEHEEHLKNIVSDFLKDTWYKQTNEINTSGRTDLVIHNGKSSSDTVGVLIEVKRPDNNTEMISPERPNTKALHELLHYYMQERYLKGNMEVRRLIVCNIYEWYIFDASDFERLFFHNRKFVENYQKWSDGLFSGDKTDWLYRVILKPFVENELETLPCTYFNLKEYARFIRKPEGEDDRKLISLYKLLSPPHLLKQSFANDANSLNREFYSELLHIIGLEEVKEKGKKLINRKAPDRRNEGSLLENAINMLKVRNKLAALGNPEQFGANEDEQYFSLGLELCITWLNRILFLKLLEGQLRSYHRGNHEYAFLNTRRIADFDELEELFFEVLARRNNDRAASVQEKFGDIPYLNSSLFEESDLERTTIHIAALKGRLDLELHGATVLKNAAGKRLTGKKSTLSYLFEFLDAYDFSSEGEAEIQDTPRSIINASVLGLIFEKINGYRDGSFYTPGFITMYICRETIRRAVVERFNAHFPLLPQGEGRGEGGSKRRHYRDFDDLRDRLDSSDREVRKRANAVIDKITVCDPAVGSGHFLVSALNELITVKSELGILSYRDNGDKIKEYRIIVENDELIVTDKDDDRLFAYTLNRNDRPIDELQRLQETLFHEKETIIENCLFGVDINPKSVAICRLRLWIELLKNAYYTRESGYAELETLPNIDINIKCGNSLVSRFALGNTPSLPAVSRNKLKELTEKYRRHVFEYKLSPANKAQLRKVIDGLKHDLENFGLPNDKDLIALRRKENEVAQLGFAFDKKGTEERRKLMAEVEALQKRFAEKERLVYSNAFEWRFEFPEVLDEEGEFVGFDAIIGNPPYIRQEAIKEQKPAFMEMFGSFFCGTADIYTYFYKTGLNLLKTGGNLCYIAPNKFMRAGYGKNTRDLLTTQARPLMVLDFGDLPIFDEATTYPSIVMVEKCTPSPQPSPSGRGGKKANPTTPRPPGEGGRRPGEGDFFTATFTDTKQLTSFDETLATIGFTMPVAALRSEGWALERPEVLALMDKLRVVGTPLSDHFYRGITTGLNEVFVVDGDCRQLLIDEDPRSAEIIMPWLQGRDIRKWRAEWAGLYVIFTRKGTDLDQYPAIKRHLEMFRDRLMPKPDDWDRKQENKGKEWPGRKPGPYKWFEIQDNIAYFAEFASPKIISTKISIRPTFALDATGSYLGNTSYFTPIKSEGTCLLALLNSKLFEFYARRTFAGKQNGYFEVQPEGLEAFPIPLATDAQKAPIIERVQKILAVPDSPEVPRLEAEIDRLVYALYGLTDDEIAVVEGKS